MVQTATGEGGTPGRDDPQQEGQATIAGAESEEPMSPARQGDDGIVTGTVVSPSGIDTTDIDELLEAGAEDADAKARRLAVEKKNEALVADNQGLWNQGCTCYLNSLLQLFFHISYFREAVYRMATDGDGKGTDEIPKALQNLFFQLQERKSPSATNNLTDAFGWEERDVMIQHDIQELAAKLRDTLERKMKGTTSEGAIDRMFKGYGEQVTATKDGTYASRRQDTFYDVHLPVAKYATMAESLESLTSKDQLSGDNKYKVEEDGKPAVYKDAEMGYEFRRFPPVLLFHLKRFEMDMTSPTLEMHKINSKFEFNETIDLSQYETGATEEIKEAMRITPLTGGGSQKTTTSSPPGDAKQTVVDADGAIYDLYSVIVHRGGVRSGHYYCYIRDFDHDTQQWGSYLCYDDEGVAVADNNQVFDRNFGGTTWQWFNGRQVQVPSTNNAYILAYMRRSEVSKLIYPISTNAIPEHIKAELHRVMEADELRQKEEDARNKTVTVTLVTPDLIRQHVQQHIWDLTPTTKQNQPLQHNMRVLSKAETFAGLQQACSDMLGGTPPEDFRLWRMGVVVQNTGIRPDVCLNIKHDTMSREAAASAAGGEGGSSSSSQAPITLQALFQEKHQGEDASSCWAETIFIELKQTQVAPEQSNLIQGDVKEVKVSSTLKDNGKMVDYIKGFNNRIVFGKEDKKPKLLLEFNEQRSVHTISFRVNTSANEMTRRHFLLRLRLYDVNPLSNYGLEPVWEEDKRVESDVGKSAVGVRTYPTLKDGSAPQAKWFTLEEIKQTQLDHVRAFGIRSLQIYTHSQEVPEMQLKPYPATTPVLPKPPAPESLPLMIKLFNHKTGTFSFLGLILVNKFDPLSNACPSIRHLMGLPADQKPELLLYDESKPHPLTRLRLEWNCTDMDANLFNGNIVTVQLHPRSIPMVYRFLTAEAMYKHHELKRTINFRNLKGNGPSEIAFTGQVQGDWNFSQVVEFIGDTMHLHPDYIRLYCPTYTPGTHKPEPEKSTTKKCLDDLTRVGQYTWPDLYFEPLDTTLQQLEGNPTVNLKLCDALGQQVHEIMKVTIKANCNPAYAVTRLLETISSTHEDDAEMFRNDSKGCFAFVFRTGSVINHFLQVNLNNSKMCNNADFKLPPLRGDRVYELRYFVPPAEGQQVIAMGQGDYRQQPHLQPFGTPFLFNISESEPAGEVFDRAVKAAGTQEVDPEKVDKEYPMLIYTTQMFKLNSMSEPLWGYVRQQDNQTNHMTHTLICHPKPLEKPGSRYKAQKEPQLNLEKKA